MRSQPIDRIAVVTDGTICGHTGRIWLRRRRRLLVATEALMLQGVTLREHPELSGNTHCSYADKSAIAARECGNGYVAATLLTAMYCQFPFFWLPPRLDP